MAGRVARPGFDRRLWPHVYWKAEFILDMFPAVQAIHVKEKFFLGVGCNDRAIFSDLKPEMT